MSKLWIWKGQSFILKLCRLALCTFGDYFYQNQVFCAHISTVLPHSCKLFESYGYWHRSLASLVWNSEIEGIKKEGKNNNTPTRVAWVTSPTGLCCTVRKPTVMQAQEWVISVFLFSLAVSTSVSDDNSHQCMNWVFYYRRVSRKTWFALRLN